MDVAELAEFDSRPDKGQVVELADTQDLGSCEATHGSSTLPLPIIGME